jgi:hypothetical protein
MAQCGRVLPVVKSEPPNTHLRHRTLSVRLALRAWCWECRAEPTEGTMDIQRLDMLAVSETGFVFDPRTGHSYTVNATGLAVLSELKRGEPLSTSLQRLQSQFDCPPTVAADLVAFVEALNNYDLIGRNKPTEAVI